MSTPIETKNMSELLNDSLIKNFSESVIKSQLDTKARMFLNGIVNDKIGNQMSIGAKEDLVNEIMTLFNSLGNAITKQVVHSIKPALFEKVMIDAIHFIDLPMLDQEDVEKSRKDLMNSVIHTDVEFPNRDAMNQLTVMMNSALIIGWNQLKAGTNDSTIKGLTIYNLLAAQTDVFNEAFQQDVPEKETEA